MNIFALEYLYSTLNSWWNEFHFSITISCKNEQQQQQTPLWPLNCSSQKKRTQSMEISVCRFQLYKFLYKYVCTFTHGREGVALTTRQLWLPPLWVAGWSGYRTTPVCPWPWTGECSASVSEEKTNKKTRNTLQWHRHNFNYKSQSS